MSEGDRKLGLTSKPSVRDNLDEILRRQGLKYRHEELHQMFVFSKFTAIKRHWYTSWHIHFITHHETVGWRELQVLN